MNTNYDLNNTNYDLYNSDYDDVKNIVNNNLEATIIDKLVILGKLKELIKCGVTLSQNYNTDSDFNKMKFEYHMHKNMQRKKVLHNKCDALEKTIEKLNDELSLKNKYLDLKEKECNFEKEKKKYSDSWSQTICYFWFPITMLVYSLTNYYFTK